MRPTIQTMLRMDAHGRMETAMALSFVDQTYVINLPNRTDRRREICQQFNNVGWDPDDPAITFFEAVRPTEAGEFPSIGAHGCFKSHLSILNQAAEEGLSAIAIFEDDLDFVGDYSVLYPLVEKQLSAESWHIFYGGHHQTEPINSNTPAKQIGPDVLIRATHFVCFRGKAISMARDHLKSMLARPAGDPKGGPMHVDGAYQRLREDHSELVCIVATPPLGVQRSSKSDIGDARWFDRTPLVSGIANLARRFKRIISQG